MDTSHKYTLWALLAGNFVIGTGVLAPAGLITDLRQAFAVDAATVGTLIAYGGATLCLAAPLVAYLSNPLDRRLLLTGALLLFALGHAVSTLVGSFDGLLALRLAMIASVAAFTPQAASALSLLLPREQRARGITFIFLGWSLASAIGIPLVNLLGSWVGWRMAYGLIALAAAVVGLAVWWTLPPRLQAHPLPMAAWGKVLTSTRIWGILAISCLAVAGQYMKFPYMVVDLKTNLATDPPTTALLLAVYGGASILGTMTATRVVGRLGVRVTVGAYLAVLLLGMTLWTCQPSHLLLTGGTLFIWGLGVSPAIAAQQARLIETDPRAASASTSMNTSVVYLGQASGTLIGGRLLVAGHGETAGVLAMALLTLALALSVLLHRRFKT